MGSFKNPQGAFQPHELAVLQEAFDAVWETIQAHRPSQIDNDELKTAVSDRLCQIATIEGATDAAKLRAATLASFSF
jgi:hypothetical protein